MSKDELVKQLMLKYNVSESNKLLFESKLWDKLSLSLRNNDALVIEGIGEFRLKKAMSFAFGKRDKVFVQPVNSSSTFEFDLSVSQPAANSVDNLISINIGQPSRTTRFGYTQGRTTLINKGVETDPLRIVDKIFREAKIVPVTPNMNDIDIPAKPTIPKISIPEPLPTNDFENELDEIDIANEELPLEQNELNSTESIESNSDVPTENISFSIPESEGDFDLDLPQVQHEIDLSGLEDAEEPTNDEESNISFSFDDIEPKAKVLTEDPGVVFDEVRGGEPIEISADKGGSSNELMGQDEINQLLAMMGGGGSSTPKSEEVAPEIPLPVETPINQETKPAEINSVDDFDISQFLGTPSSNTTSEAAEPTEDAGGLDDLWAMAIGEDDTLSQNLESGLGVSPFSEKPKEEEPKSEDTGGLDDLWAAAMDEDDTLSQNLESGMGVSPFSETPKAPQPEPENNGDDVDFGDDDLDGILSAVLDNDKKASATPEPEATTEDGIDDFYIPDVYDEFFTEPSPEAPLSEEDNVDINLDEFAEEEKISAEEDVVITGAIKPEAKQTNDTKKGKKPKKEKSTPSAGGSKKWLYIGAAIIPLLLLSGVGYYIFAYTDFLHFPGSENKEEASAENAKTVMVERDFSIPINYPYYKKDEGEKIVSLPGNVRKFEVTKKAEPKVEEKEHNAAKTEENASKKKDEHKEEKPKAKAEEHGEKKAETAENKHSEPTHDNNEKKAPANHTPETGGKANVFFDGQNYFVQVSSYKLKFVAESEAKRIATQYKVNTVVVSADLKEKGLWYRVRVGPFKTSEQAEQKGAGIH